jgi:glycosyltransferase involved in cell wall biosynthesis
MKVLFLVHGYPPELCGGTERHVQQLAEWIAASESGHEVVVCAGTLHGGPGAEERWEECAPRGDGEPIRVLRLPRTDLYYDHWQKSSSPAITGRVRELIRAERPDVVSVHHWTRLSRDLVLAAAREGVPAHVHLHDYWSSCPIALRVKPTDGSFCESSPNGMVCPPCAGSLPPFTPWVSMEEHFIAIAERQADLQRELKLARTVSAPSRAHAQSAARFMDGALDVDSVRVLPPAAATASSDAPRSSREFDGPPLVLAHWGGLSRLKGTDLLFEAVAGLRDPSAVQLELAGVEERPGFLDDLHARFPAVAFTNHGAFDAAELRDHAVAQAHAAVFPTRAHESYGFTFDESLHLGLPCAVADSPAFRERAEDGAGVRFFARDSAAALTGVLQSWIDEPASLGVLRSGVEQVRATLLGARSTSAYLELLEETIALGPPDPATLPPEDWFSDRIKQHALEEWDRQLSECSARELGLE